MKKVRFSTDIKEKPIPSDIKEKPIKEKPHQTEFLFFIFL